MLDQPPIATPREKPHDRPDDNSAKSNALFAKYGSLPVPRYTSYPTAPHFQPDFDISLYQSWLRATDPETPISLYVHIPFCWQICWYCGCNMKLVKRADVISHYVGLLCREIDLVTAHLPPGVKVGTLHFGGGTPTSMSVDDITRLMTHLRARFDLSDLGECAIETDPRTVTPEMIALLPSLGFNRISFGIQEFADPVQKAINRIQPYDMVADVVRQCRAAGIEDINFDILYGLPHQSLEGLRETLSQCMTLGPSRVSAFGYAHVPWMAKRQRMIDETHLPKADERRQQMACIETALTGGGYAKIGLDHFALPDDPLAVAARNGRLQRNFQGYTADPCPTLIGIGTTAIGKTAGGYVQNMPDTKSYGDAVEAGQLPVKKGLALSPDDHIRAAAIESLMCSGTLDLVALCERYGERLCYFSTALEELKPLIGDGLVTLRGHHMSITDIGLPFQRLVAQVFDAYRQSAARHSVAV